jgi:DUF1365 family protein
MNSCIYEGSIRHRRFAPVGNRFQYRLFFMYLDLSELPGLFEPYRLWSADAVNVAYLRRRDHLGDPGIPLDQAVRNLVEERLGRRPTGPIRMLTHLRYFGYCFNPVSFYYCFNTDDTQVDTIVTEIHNTPWLEEFPYVLDHSANEHDHPEWRRFRFDKQFHVSPFMDMDVAYDWRFRVPGKYLNVHMINYRGGAKLFDASLALARREISAASLRRALLIYPLMTAKVTFLIYWQALRLLLKKTPFYEHPDKRALGHQADAGDVGAV